MKRNVKSTIDSLLESKLREVAENYPGYWAVQDLNREPVSFERLLKVFVQIRTAVCDAGLRSGDRVAIWLEDRADMAIWIGALSALMECIPLSRSISSQQVGFAFETLKPAALISDGRGNEVFGAEATRCGIPVLEATSDATNEWSWQVAGRVPVTDRAQRTASPDDVAVILMTSGSTAAPKLVPVTHRAIVTTVLRSADGLELQPGERCLNVMPLNHVHGLVSGTFLPWLAAGTSVLPGEFSAQSFISWNERFRPNWFSMSPAIYSDILRRAQTAGICLQQPELRFVRCGSAALNPTLASEIETAFSVPLLEAYGMSETLQISGIPFAKRCTGSVGLAIADEVQVFDDRGSVCKSGVSGEICVRGRSVMPHYLGGEEPHSGFVGEWFSTGDLGYLNEQGFLFVTGRLKELINVGGENIAPAEVEAGLARIQAIDECVCFAIPHPTLGDALAAAVVLHADHDTTVAEIRRLAAQELPAQKIPGSINIVQRLPRDANGKVNRPSVAKLVSANTENEPLLFGPVEHWLARHFEGVLRGAKVSADNDFFALGGSSLDAFELLTRLQNELNATIHIPLLLEAPSVRKLARTLQQKYPNAIERVTGAKQQEKPTGHRDALSEQNAFKRSIPAFDGRECRRSDVSPVFILSAPRCGSTLLRVMLAGHPGIFAPPELRLLNYRTMDQWMEAHKGKFQFFREGLIKAFMAAEQSSLEAAQDWLERAAKEKFPVETAYEKLQGATGSKIIVDKSPLYALDTEILASAKIRFRQPRFIVLRRSPSEMKRSFVEAHMDQLWMYAGDAQPDSLAEMIWRQCYNNIETFASSLDRRHLIRVYFEDLVRQPYETTTKICQFLGLPYDREVLNPYGDADPRMTNGLKQSTGMIGDPRFFRHSKIDADRAGSGFQLQDHPTLDVATIDLAKRMGYKRASVPSEFSDVIQRQKSLVKSWKGDDHSSDFVFGRNTSGTKTPLFWCFQGERAFQLLARALGSTQPVYGMRSAHLLVNKFDTGVRDLGRLYARQIEHLHPVGPLVIGGNCQGAYVALEILRELAIHGRSPELFFVMEADFEASLDVPVAHIYGKASHHNPFIKNTSPDQRWSRQYPSHTVDLIPCKHGKFFKRRNLTELCRVIRSRMKVFQIAD